MPAEAPVALITGAARRIGAAIARELHDTGFRVLIHCRESLATARELCAQLQSIRADSAAVLTADLADFAQVRELASAAVNHWGRLDALVNNASAFYPTPLAEAGIAEWDDLMASNLKAPFFLCRDLAPALAQSGGAIVNIADIHGLRPLPEHAVYCIAKAGNMMLTRVMARELAPRVRVNGIAPGAILWPENPVSADASAQQKILHSIALGRLGAVADIARLTRFLLTDASYVTGQVIAVDGGAHLALATA
ncbi:MAG: pteridine reductase [Gammaproteobacteria bacterium]|nr:pteridine reductase [Gammaproteobacteria bacterium]